MAKNQRLYLIGNDMNCVTLGILMCLSSLIILSNGQALIGILLFVAGIYVMNRNRRK